MSTARVVADRYSLIRPIGRGSAAVVYVAKDSVDGRMLAVKLIPARPGLRHDEVQQFTQDVTRTPEHEGITPFLDAGLDADGKTLFLTMELLHGNTLRDLIDDPATAADRDRRLDLLEAILDPLAFAHGQGVVHGDLTPSNIFEVRPRDGEPRVTLLDLGLADVLQRGRYAAPGITVGATRFMSPERLSGSRPGTPADVWAFGIALYEAVSGRRPFDGLSQDSLVRSVCDKWHRPLDEIAPEVDHHIARLVDLCLDKTPGQRPHDARALMRLLKTLRSGFGASRGGAITGDTVLDRAGAAPSPPPEDLDAALRRNPRDPQTHRAILAFYQNEENLDGVWLAATALDFLGGATREEIQLHHHHRRPAELPADRGLDAGGWAALLHPDQDPRIDAVWREIVPAIAALHCRPDDSIGLDPSRRVDVGRASDELTRAFRLSVGAFRPSVIPRLFRAKAGTPPRHAPTRPAASVFGRGFEEPLPSGSLRFAIGRHVAYYRDAHRVCTFLHEPDALEAVFAAGVSLGLERDARSVDQERMMALLRDHLKPQRRVMLRTACQRLGTSAERVDLGTWRRAVELSCCRAGLALGASLEGAAWMLRWSRERRRIPTEDAMDDLLRFWSSGDHVRVRHLLGLSVG